MSGTSKIILWNSYEKVLRVRKHCNIETSDAGTKQDVEKRSVFTSFSSITSDTSAGQPHQGIWYYYNNRFKH